MIVFEDFNYKKKYPLSQTRPVFNLFLGTLSLLERIEKVYNLKCETVNRFTKERKSGVFINGSILWLKKIEVSPKKLYLINGIPAIFIADSFDVSILLNKEEVEKYFKNYEKIEIDNTYGFYLEYIYQFIEFQGKALINDFESIFKKECKYNVKIVGDPSKLTIEDDVLITDYNLFDTRKGPIIIKKGVEIIGPSLIQGPTFIGEGTLVDAGKVRGSFLGKVCKISGEIEESIFLDFTNKHHEGFVGHSYAGSFVNFGALSTTSDLKNNYSTIRVFINDNYIDTGVIKLGAFIGDHTRLGIGTLINSGSVIGSFSNLFGGGMLPKFIPPFSWGSGYPFKKYDIKRLLSDVSKVAARRGETINEEYRFFIDKLYNEVEDEKYNKFDF